LKSRQITLTLMTVGDIVIIFDLLHK